MISVINKNKQLIIYLDQFASVGLFESNNAEWNKIKELIAKGFESGNVICPLSPEHYFETVQKTENKAIRLDKEYSKFSGGFSFKPELFITSQLISSLIRKNNITLKTYLYDKIKGDILSKEKNINAFIDNKIELDLKIKEATKEVNEIRKIARNEKIDIKTKKHVISAQKSINVSEFIMRLNDLLNEEHILISGVKFESGDVPYWVDQVIFQLTNKHKFKRKETVQLISELKKNGFNNIPTLDIRTSLSAIISLYNKKETVNDQIDIMRIATGLPLANILFADKQRKREILELGLDIKYGTKIFSGTKSDLEKLIAELE
ncbi:hypothetical protein [Plebeiibacterium sediminum]|uniref:Uncharacterized protein n=1 Tax=Plebeiibacterium sediminum TaxID=2992112 RepID=A0AAE3M9C8_9BACT|nr:hypothetical protein [Plebeiobacterium sediminum]MCW3789381.1 hypothetical protein [Plebeiobacterium sediminum]